MKLDAVLPTRVEEDCTDGKEVFTHPAFGMLRIGSPNSGKGVRLFGSDLEHNSYISLEFAFGNLQDSYGSKAPRGSHKRSFVRLAMTHAQFASLANNVGNAAGVPVTYEILPCDIKNVERVPPIAVEDTPLDVSRETFKKEVRKQVNDALSALADLKTAVANKRTGKALIEMIAEAESRINSLPGNLSSNFDFANQVIQETAKEAQINAEGIINQRLREIGVSAVAQDANVFLQIEKKDD